MIDKRKASEVLEFLSMLKLADDFYGQSWVLMDWQTEMITDVYGTVDDRGLRQYVFAYLEMAKKNSKTTTIAGLGLYHLVCDAPQGQIYCCAVDKYQAGLVYKAAKVMVEQDEDLQKIIKVVDSKKELINRLTGTILKVLSSDAPAKHGLNPTVVIFDELHAQPNRELWDIMTFGSGASRKEPLYWIITTAGDDPDRHSIGWEKHEYAQKIIDGEIVDPTWWARIYAVPEDADPFDEANWYKANPSLGITLSIESVRREALQARNSEASLRLFRWLRLNHWVATKRTSWLPLSLWDERLGSWGIDELSGQICYAGLDLSSTTDITGVCLLFPPQGNHKDWRQLYEAWIPEDSMKERSKRDHVPYDVWVRNRYMHATPGNVVDYEFIEARIKALSKQYKIEMVGADPWNSYMLLHRLTKARIKAAEIPQTMAGLSPAMKEIERLLRSSLLTHESHPVARWCFGNTCVAIDGNENIKPMKNKSFERIDLTVAAINAMATAIKCGATVKKCPYTGDRGLILI